MDTVVLSWSACFRAHIGSYKRNTFAAPLCFTEPSESGNWYDSFNWSGALHKKREISKRACPSQTTLRGLWGGSSASYRYADVEVKSPRKGKKTREIKKTRASYYTEAYWVYASRALAGVSIKKKKKREEWGREEVLDFPSVALSLLQSARMQTPIEWGTHFWRNAIILSNSAIAKICQIRGWKHFEYLYRFSRLNRCLSPRFVMNWRQCAYLNIAGSSLRRFQ